MPTSRISPNSAGFLLGIRDYINRWEALEFELGYARRGSQFFSAPTAPTSTASPLNASVLRLNLNEVLTVSAGAHFQPFVLVGGGVAAFQPVAGSRIPARSQIRPIGALGAGANMRVVHMGVRLEVEGLFYRTPDFHNPSIQARWSHVAQPSAGLIFSF
ncbi:MAG: hypothetical protein ACRD1L_09945 [Terriglobales bacterium]